MVSGANKSLSWKLKPNTSRRFFIVWGDKIGGFNIQQGENLEFSVYLESREYNER